jgi:hypothetical protein
MSGRKWVYSLVILLFTASTVTMMVHFGRMSGGDGLDYVSPYYAYENEDDSRYIGYIFDDYNKSVNLAYKDKASAEPVDDGAISISSGSVLDTESTRDNMSMQRSERIIEEREQMEGK